MIDIYGKPFCDACEIACTIVERAGKPYNYYNVEQLTAQEMTYLVTEIAPGAKMVPILVVDGRVIGDLNEFRSIFEGTKESSSTRVG